MPWPRLVLALIGVYVLAGIGFWGYFLGWVVPELVRVAITYPGNLWRAGQEILNGTITIEQLESLFLPTFAVVGLALIVSRLFRWSGRTVQTTVRQRRTAHA